MEKAISARKTSREITSLIATQRITDGMSTWGLRKFKNESFRSKYEYAFAEYLRVLGIKFQYEKRAEEIENFSGEMRHYIPDFYLPAYRCYVEIVNVMDRRLMHKMYDLKQQNKFAKLIVLDVKHLREIFDSKYTFLDVLKQKGMKKYGK